MRISNSWPRAVNVANQIGPDLVKNFCTDGTAILRSTTICISETLMGINDPMTINEQRSVPLSLLQGKYV